MIWAGSTRKKCCLMQFAQKRKINWSGHNPPRIFPTTAIPHRRTSCSFLTLTLKTGHTDCLLYGTLIYFLIIPVHSCGVSFKRLAGRPWRKQGGREQVIRGSTGGVHKRNKTFSSCAPHMDLREKLLLFWAADFILTCSYALIKNRRDWEKSLSNQLHIYSCICTIYTL